MSENKTCRQKRSGNEWKEKQRVNPMSKNKELEGRVPGQEEDEP